MAKPSTFDPKTNTKACPHCKARKVLEEFARSNVSHDGRSSWCNICRLEWQNTHPEARLASQRKSKYKLAPGAYDILFKAQKGCCAICYTPFITLSDPRVDHAHQCCPDKKSCGKCVRGLLCDNCNIALGRFKDNPLILQSAIDYLNRYKQ